MADISKINIPNGGSSVTYNLKDASVPHSSLPAVEGGGDLSLVTTGEKAEWIDKTKIYQVECTLGSYRGMWNCNLDLPALYDGLLLLCKCPSDTYNNGGTISLYVTLSDGTVVNNIVIGGNLSNVSLGEYYLFRYSVSDIVTTWGWVGALAYGGRYVSQHSRNTSYISMSYPLLFSDTAADSTSGYMYTATAYTYRLYYDPCNANLVTPKINNYTLAPACEKQVDTEVIQSSSNLVTSGAVYTAIDNLPEPMVFKGTLGTGGTITTLPTASSSNEGYTYKVITAGTYASQSAKVGDVFVSNGSAWVLIPSGDTDSDTWRNIKVNGTELLGSAISTGAINFKSGANTTVSGSGNNITISSTDTNTTYSLTQDTSDRHKITLTPSSGTAQTVTIPDNNTTYTFANGTNGFTVTPSGGTAQTVTVTPSITNNVTGSGTSGYIAKFNGTNTVTNGPALGSDTTKYLRNDGTWVQPPNTNTTYTLGTSSNSVTLTPSSGSVQSITVPYSTLSNTVNGVYTGNGGQQGPNYFGKNRVGFLMSNASVAGDSHYKNWLYMDNYNGTDVGGATALGIDRTEPRAFIMQSDANRTSWNNTAALGVFTATPTSGQVVVTDGTTGGIKSSGYTIAKSVPSNAVFTDNNTTYTLSTSGDNVVLTPSSGSANTITVPYATNAGKVNNLTVQTAVPTNAKFTDTTYTFANGTNGFTVTPSGGTAQTVTVTPSITNNVTGSGTSGYLAKFNGAHTITNGVALGSSTTTFLRNDGTWATPPSGTDTKNTAGSTNNTGKLYLVGALEQSANPQTYSNSGVWVEGADGRIGCGKMSYVNEAVTFSKSSGSWTFRDGEYTRSGQVVQIRISFKGGGSNVSVGSNAIAGTINGIPHPPYTVRLQGYYSGTVLMGELTTSGGFNVRILGQALNLSSSNAATMSGTYIVED